MKRLRICVVALSCLVFSFGAMAAQTQAPQKNPPKPPAEPIDPNATAGVRGAGYTVTVRAVLKGKPVNGAYVVAKNANGTVAGTGNTNDAGECLLNLGEGDYALRVTQAGIAGAISLHVTGSQLVVVKLHKEPPVQPTGKQ